MYQHHIYLQPEGSELKAFISLPLDQFKPWQEFAQRMGGTNYSGRYLNGIVYTALAVTNGLLEVKPRQMEIRGQPLPKEFIKQFPWKTVTQPVNENTNFRSALRQVEKIEIADGKVRVTVKP
jgi:hypothetical protein